MSQKEVRTNVPQVYKIFEALQDGEMKVTGNYRVRKRIVVAGKWTTRVKTFATFDDAKRYSKLPHIPQSTIPVNGLLFEEAFGRFMRHKEVEMKLSRGTIQGYWNRYFHLKFFEGMKMENISPKTIDAWINLLLDPEYLNAQQSSRISYDHEFTLLSCFLKYYRNFEDELFVVPILDRHRQRACARSKASYSDIRFLNSQEEVEFLSMLEANAVIHDLALFQLHVGARVGEAAALEFRDIDFVRNEVRIAQHLHWERKSPRKTFLIPGTKSGPTRSVPLTSECLAMLRKRKASAVSTRVFQDPKKDDWLAYRSIQSVYDQAFKKMGVQLRGTHTLRHTFAVRFLDQTKDIYSLQRILGHTDLKVTQIYAKYSNESVRRSFQLFKGGLDQQNDGLVPSLVPRIGK